MVEGGRWTLARRSVQPHLDKRDLDESSPVTRAESPRHGHSVTRAESPRHGREEKMRLTLRHELIELAFRDPFRIARALDTSAARTVIVELTYDAWPGHTGLGEGFADAYYGETP